MVASQDWLFADKMTQFEPVSLLFAEVVRPPCRHYHVIWSLVCQQCPADRKKDGSQHTPSPQSMNSAGWPCQRFIKLFIGQASFVSIQFNDICLPVGKQCILLHTLWSYSSNKSTPITVVSCKGRQPQAVRKWLSLSPLIELLQRRDGSFSLWSSDFNMADIVEDWLYMHLLTVWWLMTNI